ncbi:MAG: DUF368 domain-containing protein [Clostridia bacterium]|jgi:putative membrane protein
MMKSKSFPIFEWLLLIIKGAVVGAGAILPGISGGVLCVTFGIYEPLMALLAHPFRNFRKYYKMLIPFVIGVGLGFLGLAKLVDLLFNVSSGIAISLFIGLIAGTLPSLFMAADKNGPNQKSWIGFIISLLIMFTVLSFLGNGSGMDIEPNIWWWVFCGVMWGFSLVIPGLSSSTILIFMGLYEPMAEGIGDLNFKVLIPLGIGLAITVLLSARLVNAFFEKYHSMAYHVILGVVIASTILIIPSRFVSIWDTVISLVCFTAGFLVSYFMDRIGDIRKSPSESK